MKRHFRTSMATLCRLYSFSVTLGLGFGVIIVLPVVHEARAKT